MRVSHDKTSWIAKTEKLPTIRPGTVVYFCGCSIDNIFLHQIRKLSDRDIGLTLDSSYSLGYIHMMRQY